MVVDGVIYVTTAWSKVYAVNAKTGVKLWSFDPKVPGPAAAKNCCDVVSRGAAVYHGKVYVGTYDGRLIALDAATGAPVWTAVTADPDQMYTISGAPRVGAGLVFIGNGGGEFGGRGYVTAYNADTGEHGLALLHRARRSRQARWRGLGRNHGQSSCNRPGSVPTTNTAAAAWCGTRSSTTRSSTRSTWPPAMAFPGRAGSGPTGKGDNLFICSVVALDAKTGHYKWHYQETPGDSWDYDSIADMILADLTIGGTQRKVLMHTPKNGFFYNIDRRDGKLISAEPYVPGVTWASHVDMTTGRPVVSPAAYYTNKPVRLSPGEGGGHSWQPTAFSPKTGLMYLQANANASTRYIPQGQLQVRQGHGLPGPVALRAARTQRSAAQARPQRTQAGDLPAGLGSGGAEGRVEIPWSRQRRAGHRGQPGVPGTQP